MATETHLIELADRLADVPPTCTASGEPYRRAVKIVNGHRVTAAVIGWGENPAYFLVDYSCAPLTFDAAIKAVR